VTSAWSSLLLVALCLEVQACGRDESTLGSGGAGGSTVLVDASVDAFGGTGAGDSGNAEVGDSGNAEADAAPEAMSARFANFESTLPPFDVCLRAFWDGGFGVVPGVPYLAAHGITGGVLLDQVTARVPIPLATGELFPVRVGTTDCTAPDAGIYPTGMERVFPTWGSEREGYPGERRTHFAAASILYVFPDEPVSCSATAACLVLEHMLNYHPLPETGQQGPLLTLELVTEAARASIFTDQSFGGGQYPDPPFQFGPRTGVVEIPVSGAQNLRLALREKDVETPMFEFDLTEAAGQMFTLFAVGHAGGSGVDAPRVVVCRDFAPESSGLSQCTRIAP
jgi:hypothetical protein